MSSHSTHTRERIIFGPYFFQSTTNWLAQSTTVTFLDFKNRINSGHGKIIVLTQKTPTQMAQSQLGFRDELIRMGRMHVNCQLVYNCIIIILVIYVNNPNNLWWHFMKLCSIHIYIPSTSSDTCEYWLVNQKFTLTQPNKWLYIAIIMIKTHNDVKQVTGGCYAQKILQYHFKPSIFFAPFICSFLSCCFYKLVFSTVITLVVEGQVWPEW